MVMRTDLPDDQAVAIDFETYYSTRDRYTLGSVKGKGDEPAFPGMPPVQYCEDERFDPYLVSLYGPGISRTLPPDDNGCQLYVGRPENFDSWDLIRDRIVLAHNAGFDEVVLRRCQELGLVPELPGIQVQDTIDLARYLMTPGSLKDSMKYLFGREISKAVRAAMDGRHVSDLTPKELDDLIKYGGDDAKECWEIWHVYSKYWPEIERKISCQLRESIIRGIKIDVDYATRALNQLRNYQESLLADLPWYPYDKPNSVNGFKNALIRIKLNPPKSVAKNNPDFIDFMNAHRDVPFIDARLKYAATVPHMRRLEVLTQQLDRNGFAHPGIKYFGAHSGRTSAGTGDSESNAKNVNMLNMTRSAVFKGIPEIMDGKGIDMRRLNVARPGYKFVIFDYSQVEARFLLWLVNDTHMMSAMHKEGNLYQANAVEMGWCKSGEDIKHNKPDLYRLAKCCLCGDSLVLVRSERRSGRLTYPYYKSITRVKITDRVWDGHEWVRHLGVRKIKEVNDEELVEIGGVRLTGDHRVYVGEAESRRADALFGDEKAAAVAWGQSNSPVQGWAQARALATAFARTCTRAVSLGAREAVHVVAGALRMPRLRQRNQPALVMSNALSPANLKSIASTMTEITSAETCGGRLAPSKISTDATVCALPTKEKSTYSETLSQSIARSVCLLLKRCIIKVSRWTRLLEKKAAVREGRTAVPVYDIVEAGSRHRFCTVGPIVSNCVLGLGYQMGAVKFIDSCRAQGLDFPSLPRDQWPSLDENMFYLRNIAEIPDPRDPKYEHRVGQVFRSRQIVNEWRQANAKTAEKWRQYHDAMYMAAAAKKDKFVLRLRSGRKKVYFNPRIVREVKTQYDEKGVAHPRTQEALQAVTVLGKPARFFTGGNIVENVVQGTCRDIMNYGAVEIEEKHPSWKFVLSVYDEVIFEVPEAEVEEARVAMPEIMCRGDYIKDWTQGLPLDVEGCVSDYYVK